MTYSLTNDGGGRFTIDPATGRVSVANSSLLSSVASYNITVRAAELAGVPSSQNFTITVLATAVQTTTFQNGVNRTRRS